MNCISGMIKDRTLHLTLISCFFTALCAHGQALFNKISYHDDIICFHAVGATFDYGRWMLSIVGNAMKALTGMTHYSTPTLNGIITILFLAISAYLIIKQCQIKNSAAVILISALFVSFPSITASFGFIYAAPYYYFGVLLAVIGAYFFYSSHTRYSMLVCIVLTACAAGIYQAIIPVSLCTLLLFALQEVHYNAKNKSDYFRLLSENILISISFILLYFVLNTIFLKLFHIQISDTRWQNGSGFLSYVLRIGIAYREFFLPIRNAGSDMFPYHVYYFNLILTFFMVFLSGVHLRNLIKENRMKAYQEGFLFLLIPLACCFIFVMCDAVDVHGLMTFGMVYRFLFLIWILENTVLSYKKIKPVTLVLLSFISFLYIRFANICYLKAQLMQANAISYYNILITTIKTVPGYTEETPVAYIGEYEKAETDFKGTVSFDPIYLTPYEGNSIINDYCWKETMERWCGYSPKEADSVPLEGRSEVNEMPCYPADGSVKLIGDTLVVKFAD